MVNLNRAEDITAENERSLSTLIRTMDRFQGKFSLTLVCCNYASLRDAMLQKMGDRSTVAYQELVLEPATKILHQTILNAVQEQPPKALIVVGMESVIALDDLLAGANRSRDQFKQDFAFPLILWVTDAVLAKFSRSANDLKSWAPPLIQFIMPIDDLMNLLQQKASQAFADVENFKLDDCEIESLENDLLNVAAGLDPELQASWQFIRGIVEFKRNQVDLAIKHYEQSLAFWQQNCQLERQGIVCQKIAQAYNRKAELHRAENQHYWQEARKYLQQSLESFEQAQRNDLAAKCISELGEVILHLEAWEELENLAKKALEMHIDSGTPSQIAEDWGFLAEVALHNSDWERVCRVAESALAVLAQTGVSQQEAGLHLLLLAKGQRNLIQSLIKLSRYPTVIAKIAKQSESPIVIANDPIQNLELAKQFTKPQDDVQLYLRILEELRTLYFERGEYLKAFDLKLEQQAVKSKYGFQAFIGAGRLQPPQQIIDIGLASGQSKAEIVEKIVAASGRAINVQDMIQRIATPAGKLTIIHGQSGVGKSSIIQAGLVPALERTTLLETRDILPILLEFYHDWARDCGQRLKAGIEQIKDLSLSTPIDTPTAILEQLRLNQDRNLLTVLIFDQFEEFFFAYREPSGRRELYNFLGECLNQISDLKIILSLREDYLFYLLEFNRATNLSIIDNDILTKKICYYLGNFSISDATTVVQTLTKGSQFYLDEDLVNALIEDLAGKLGEVRPIELQVVGMQLEKRQITQLSEYQQLGSQAKLKLIEEFLAEVIADCGKENKGIAELVLYLLTDENNTRPQKSLSELTANSGSELETLKLVIEIVVKSGLVLEVSATPIDRYQLVHDYLVPFVRKLQSAELIELREKSKKDEAEKQRLKEATQKVEQLLVESQRKAQRRIGIGTGVLTISLIVAATVMGVAWQQVDKAQKLAKEASQELNNTQKLTKLERSANDASRLFESGNNRIDTLISAMKTGKELKATVKDVRSIADYPIFTPQIALNVILDNIREQNRFKRHQDSVRSVSFSSDGKYIATASVDRTAMLWNSTGKLIQIFRGHQNLVNSVSFSPDGKYIATASDDKTARLWDLTGNMIQKFTGHQGGLLSVSFSPDGKYIATTSKDRTARLWDLKGNMIKEFKGHQDEVKSVSFSPDGKYIATASDDKTARLWDLTGNMIQEFKGHQDWVFSVSFSPDGKYIATTSKDNTARLWDLTGKLIQEFKGHQDSVWSVNFSPDGKYIATASDDNTARLWDLTGKLIQEFKGHQDWVFSVSFSPDGKYIATGSGDKTARLWDLTGILSQKFKGHRKSVLSVNFSPDGKYIATGSGDKTARLWDLTGNMIQEFQGHQDLIWSVSFSPDGRYIATASDDKTARLWDLTGKLIKEFKGHQNPVRSVSFSPDSKYIATGSGDNTARLWDLEGNMIKEFKGHEGWVLSVSFSPDGKYIATASGDNTARLWDLEGNMIKEFKGHQALILSVSFSPDGKYIATASKDNTARLWDLTGKLIQEFKEPQSPVWDVSFSPDGKYIATASGDNTTRLWNLTGNMIQEFRGHQSPVWSVSFSPDGKYIATGSGDKTARLWKIRSLDEMLVEGCDRLHDYLQNNAEEIDKHLCDDITPRKDEISPRKK